MVGSLRSEQWNLFVQNVPESQCSMFCFFATTSLYKIAQWQYIGLDNGHEWYQKGYNLIIFVILSSCVGKPARLWRATESSQSTAPFGFFSTESKSFPLVL